MDFETLIKEIEKRMVERGLTISSLATLAGVEQKNIYNWLVRKTKPASDRVVSDFSLVLNYLGIDIMDFVDTKTLGGRIKCLRLKNGLSMYQLSLLIPCHVSIIGDWEANKAHPRYVDKIAKALRCTADYILTGEPEQVRNGLVDLPQPTVQIDMEEAVPVEVSEPEVAIFNNDNWQNVVLQLKADMFVKEFARHLSVLEYEKGCLTLGLSKDGCLYLCYRGFC
jgi:DNA-binding transcriptional regulator YiaG